MLFNSYEFVLCFLPLCVAIYFYLNRQRMILAGKSFLLLASLIFYSWWNIAYLPLIVISMIFNYAVGTALNNQSVKINKKALLTVGVLLNVAALSYFKYTDFFITNINVLMDTKIPILELILPLAISFFTFQQIAYLVDSYRKETTEYDFLNYAVFVSFFPQLIAGPIVHHKEMMPQFERSKNLVLNYGRVHVGLFLFSVGLVKKVVIADSFSLWANVGFEDGQSLSLLQAWVTSLSYSLQLYFDFSGYCDMAMGAAMMFNIKLPLNFASPYKAFNIQDFWRRWHMTLSRFLRDYIYVPLGGNRKGILITVQNIMITFVIGGLWHGAGWGFIIWGSLHGLALVIYRLWGIIGVSMPKVLAWFITFNFINISWLFFRAETVERAVYILNAMFQPITSINEVDILAILTISCGMVMVTVCPNSNALQSKRTISWFESALIAGCIFTAFTIYEVRSSSEFLYFQF